MTTSRSMRTHATCSRGARALGCAARHVVAERVPRPRRPPARAPRVHALGVYEVDDGFRAPATSGRHRPAHHFRHYPVPARAASPVGPTIGLSLVLISPKEPQDAQALRDWADFVHIRHIAAGRRARLHDDHAVRERHGRRSAVHPLLRDRPRRSRAVFKSMTPLVRNVIGDEDTEAFKHWAYTTSLRIMYVNTFTRLGEQSDVSDFFAVVRRQRACRAFADTPVDDVVDRAVLDAATYAPSAENKQPWEFVVVRDHELRAGDRRSDRARLGADGRAFAERRLTAAVLAEVDRGAPVAAAAPRTSWCARTWNDASSRPLRRRSFRLCRTSCSAAGALGLGSALTTLTTGYRAELRELLALPEHVDPVAVVPLGYPARPLGLSRRNPSRPHAPRPLRHPLVDRSRPPAASIGSRPTPGRRRGRASPPPRRQRSGSRRACRAIGRRRRRAAPRTAACTARARDAYTADAGRRLDGCADSGKPSSAADHERAARRRDRSRTPCRPRPRSCPWFPRRRSYPRRSVPTTPPSAGSHRRTPLRISTRTRNESSAVPVRAHTVGSTALTPAISPSHVRIWSTTCEPDAPSQPPPPRRVEPPASDARAGIGDERHVLHEREEAGLADRAVGDRPRHECPVGRPPELVPDEVRHTRPLGRGQHELGFGGVEGKRLLADHVTPRVARLDRERRRGCAEASRP